MSDNFSLARAPLPKGALDPLSHRNRRLSAVAVLEFCMARAGTAGVAGSAHVLGVGSGGAPHLAVLIHLGGHLNATQ